MENAPNATKPERLLSLDALRGANMFFLIGGATFFMKLASFWPCEWTKAIASQMDHVPWEGFTQHDMIFPLFLFMAGVAFPFSLAKQLNTGRTSWQIHRKIILRALAFVLLGFLYNNSVRFNFSELRFPSVLGTIGVGWMIAALVFMHSKTAVRVLYCVVVLLAYWFTVALVPAPDTAPPDAFTKEAWLDRGTHLLNPNENILRNFTPDGNILGYVDRTCIPGRLLMTTFDGAAEIIFTASVTAMLGMFCGAFIRRREQYSPYCQVGLLLLSGTLLILLGLLWNQVFPINKPLWTSSYVCLAGGISIVALALFYLVIDVLKFKRWTFFFVVIGVNSIAAYMIRPLFGLYQTNEFFFRGFADFFTDKATQELVMAGGYIAVTWGVLYFLYRNKIFFKV
ncbi:MAG: DUF5009 domain-containing protein [Planctomycetia bacterium]|nr:DUF5009 domain-containing protein [Planctomycetia bacterium]